MIRMQDNELKPIIEAALFASSQPLGLAQLAELFAEQEPIAEDRIALLLAELVADYAERGVELVEVASGWRFQVRQNVHAFVARMWTERQTRYSRALLETLALIAYRQPITRAEIEQIRGVVVSTNIIRTLEEREWVRVVGHRDVPGRPALYGTTRQFLDYFNLKRLDELPPLGEIRDLEDLEPRLELPEPTGIPLVEAIAGDESSAESPTLPPDDGDRGEADVSGADEAATSEAAVDSDDAGVVTGSDPTEDAAVPAESAESSVTETAEATDAPAATGHDDSTADAAPDGVASPSPATETDAADAATEPRHD